MRRYTDADLKRLQEHIDTNGSANGFVPTKRKRRNDEESRIQKAVVRWWRASAASFGLDPRLLASVPNGAVFGSGKERFIRAQSLKAEGLQPGYPDLLLDVARSGYHGLRIEMKKPKGVTAKNQIELHALLAQQGYLVTICRSLDDAIKAITSYLCLKP